MNLMNERELKKRIRQIGVEIENLKDLRRDLTSRLRDMNSSEVCICCLDLTPTTHNCLKRGKVKKVSDILDLLDRGPGALLAIRNLGETRYEEIVSQLKGKGFLCE
jgi:DNA-directed RNA polymerase alpha subunit